MNFQMLVPGKGFRSSCSGVARELLGRIAKGEAIGVDVLEALAFAVLDADEITRLAVRVLDDREAHRLSRAIELAARVIEGEARSQATWLTNQRDRRFAGR